MITDTLQGMSAEALKTQLIAERILHEIRHAMDMKLHLGTPDANIKTEERIYKHGSYTWNHTVQTLNLTVPETWYDDVYLQGIGSVTYKNKTTLVLEATEQPLEMLREDLRMPDTKVFKVVMPVFGLAPSGPKRPYGYQPTITTVAVEERYMVATAIDGGLNSVCYAALHVNAAGANLKKNLMKRMTSLMGV